MQDRSVAAALRLRNDLGLGSFPVNRKTKKPHFKRWQNGGLRAEASIAKVFGRHAEEAIVGVPAGQRIEQGYLYVLDVDERNGGLEALRGLPELPETVTAKTPGGFHYWFWTEAPQQTFYRPDGLELKGAGAFVIVPPAPGRHWIRDPFEFELARCPEWLLPTEIELTPTEHEPLSVVVDRDTGEVLVDLSNLAALRSSKPGNRRRTLLRVAGSVAYRVRRGLLPEAQARQDLLDAALSVGLPEREALRVIDYCLSHDSLEAPVVQEGEARKRFNTVVLVTPRDIEVLRFICGVFTQADRAFEAQAARPFATRWVCKHTGLRHPPQAARSLDALCAAGLLWRSPSTFRYKPGQRACHKYRPTYAGLTLAAKVAA